MKSTWGGNFRILLQAGAGHHVTQAAQGSSSADRGRARTMNRRLFYWAMSSPAPPAPVLETCTGPAGEGCGNGIFVAWAGRYF